MDEGMHNPSSEMFYTVYFRIQVELQWPKKDQGS